MKPDELRALPESEFETRYEEISEEYFNLRFQNGTGQLENYKRLNLVRKDLARIETIKRERELGIDVPLKAVSDAPKRRRKAASEEPGADEEAEAPEASAPDAEVAPETDETDAKQEEEEV